MARRPPPPTYRFFAGKGGVGKTTLAAASALDRAATGSRVLLVSTDPAHSLGDVLEQRVGTRPRPLPAPGRPHALELDAEGARRRWLRGRLPTLRAIAERGTYLAAEDVDALLQASLPGLGELMALLELRRQATAGAYREVLVDTAPTGHTLRLLRMPESLAQLARVLDDMQAKHRALAAALAGAYRPDEADALVEELDREARDLARLLRDPARVAFTWILEPDELALAEARDGVAALRALGMSVDEVVVNRLAPPPPGPCRLCGSRRRAQQEVLRRAAELGGALRVVPALEAEPRGAAALRALAAAVRRAPAAPRGARSRVAPPRPRERGAPAAPWALRLAPPGRRLLLFAGKGGVGKTSAAAAAALELARSGRRVLLLSTDPAHSLGDALGLELGDEETAVPGAPRLSAREIDAPAAFAARRRRYRALVDELFDGLRRGNLDAAFDRAITQDLLDLAPPGVDELFALDAITRALSEDGGHDLVVADNAPTGHALELLALPEAVLGWVRTALTVLRRDGLAARAPDLAGELVQVSRQVRGLLELMRDPQRACVVAVSRPAALPVLETGRLLAALAPLGLHAGALLVNALTPPGCARCRRAAAREREHTERLARAFRGRGGHPRHLLAAPLVAPPPRGPQALREWAAQWRILGA